MQGSLDKSSNSNHAEQCSSCVSVAKLGHSREGPDPSHWTLIEASRGRCRRVKTTNLNMQNKEEGKTSYRNSLSKALEGGK